VSPIGGCIQQTPCRAQPTVQVIALMGAMLVAMLIARCAGRSPKGSHKSNESAPQSNFCRNLPRWRTGEGMQSKRPRQGSSWPPSSSTPRRKTCRYFYPANTGGSGQPRSTPQAAPNSRKFQPATPEAIFYILSTSDPPPPRGAAQSSWARHPLSSMFRRARIHCVSKSSRKV